MKYLEKFGRFFIKPGDMVYEGQVIGFSNEAEMTLNPCKQKELKNFRVKGHEENIKINEPKIFTIEEALTFIQGEELLEITPTGLRVRKKILNAKMRKRDRRINP
jgi:GTP-binding protein